MNYISNQLLSGLNPIQQEAVKTTDGAASDGGRGKRKNTCADAQNRILNGGKTRGAMEHSGDYIYK